MCGSCYAFAASTAFSIRYCVAKAKKTGVKELVDHSPQDIASCNILTLQCDGGISDFFHKFMEDYGITTEQCQPYLDMHNADKQASPCYATGCNPNGTGPFIKHFCKKGTSVKIIDKDKIKYELMTYGPLYVSMNVYTDFSLYGRDLNGHKEIYKHVTGTLSGGHAVVLLGWGKEGDINY
jgi:hypothetical protein